MSIFLVIFPLLTGVVCTKSVLGDEIKLKNGDRISGKILSKYNGAVVVKTSYAGTLKIAWQEIESIRADKPLEIMTKNDDLTTASSFILKDKRGPVKNNEVSLDDVHYINPPAYITGRGVDWKGRADVAVSITDGNTKTNNARLAGEVVARTQKKRYTVSSTMNYAQDNDVETESNIEGLFKFDDFISKKWYLSSHLHLLKDKYKDLNLRTIFGGGIGHQFKESKLLNLSAEGGIDYVKEDFISKDDDDFPAASWAFAYDQFLLHERLQVFHNHTVNIGLKKTKDILVHAQTGIRVPVIANINATLEFDLDWDNTPGQGKKNTDTSYIMGMGYSF